MRDYGKTGDGWNGGQKSSKKDADYRKGNASEHCGICTMFRPPHGCTAVEGKVNSNMLCDYFHKK